MRKPHTVKSLEELGRIQLSKSFFMREFLYSEISQIESIPNIPDDPDLAIAASRADSEEFVRGENGVRSHCTRDRQIQSCYFI